MSPEELERRYAASDKSWVEKWIADTIDPCSPEETRSFESLDDLFESLNDEVDLENPRPELIDGQLWITTTTDNTRTPGGICEECGLNPVDWPSQLCVGCNAYQDHCV